jgi:tripartite-type tricarboxylate transporter receptor subunit TctC
MSSCHRWFPFVLGLALAAACDLARAQVADPLVAPRGIKLIVPQAPGGSTDQVARLVAERMSRALATPVHAAVPARTLQELVAYARAHPRQINYASAGVGSSNHLDAELVASASGIEWVHVPYKGSVQGMTALIAGEVQVTIANVPSALPAVQGGKARVLAILGERRTPLLPDVPTAEEAGIGSVDVRTWIGLVVPKGTPAAVVERYNAVVNDMLGTPDVRRWMDQRGIEIVGGSPASFVATLRADYAKWGREIRRLGIQAN